MEDDDILEEFLLRLPPDPSTLPRAGLVCKRWRRLVTDPRFVRRFRAFHRRTPPLHGFVVHLTGRFFPTQEAPNRLPDSRFSWRGWAVHCCRHGLVLCYRGESFMSKFMVVDPMTGNRSRISILQHDGAVIMTSTVLSVAADCGTDRRCRSFLVVALFAQFASEHEPRRRRARLTVSVYSSDSGAWASNIATVLAPSGCPIHHPSSLVGNAIYWFLHDGEIVRFDLGTQSLSIIEQRPQPPPDLQMMWIEFGCLSWILPAAEDGRRFCLAVLSGHSISSGRGRRSLLVMLLLHAAEWVLCRTVQLDKKVLPVQFGEEGHVYMQELGISGFDEESNVIFLWTNDGVFMSNVEAMEFNKVFGRPVHGCYIHPYSSF